MKRDTGVSIARHRAGVFLLRGPAPVAMAITLMAVCVSRGYADLVNSDTVAVDYKDTKQTLNIPEVRGVAEDKLLITFPKGKGLPRFGYVLLCEGRAACAPDFKAREPFQYVSDIVLSGVSKATGDPALIFFSDPLALPADIVEYIRKNRPRGQLRETGAAQELASYFGVPAGGGTVTVTSDLNTATPEPGSLYLVTAGLGVLAVFMVSGGRRGRYQSFSRFRA